MGKSKTPTFILELAADRASPFCLETSAHDEAELNARFEAARQLYNACLDEAKRRLNLLRQSKDFQEARKMPKTIKKTSAKPELQKAQALPRFSHSCVQSFRLFPLREIGIISLLSVFAK